MISGRVRALNLTVPLGSGRVGSDDLGYGPGSGFSFEPVQTSSRLTRQAGRQAERQTGKAGRLTRQAGRQARQGKARQGRQACRQADRLTKGDMQTGKARKGCGA